MYQEFYDKLKSDLLPCDNESEVAQAFVKACDSIKIKLRSEIDKNDASYNNVIIEYKDKGFFNGSANSAKFKEAVYDRLYKYIMRKAAKEGEEQEHYIGIATDGVHIAFCSMANDMITHEHLTPLNESSAERFIKTLMGESQRSLTTSNLIDDFGHNSTVGPMLMGALAKELTLHFNATDNNKIKMLFSEWRSLFGQVAGLTKDQQSKIKAAINFELPKLDSCDQVEAENLDVAGLLFVIHTYNSLIMKLLGAEIVSYFGFTQYDDFCANLAVKDGQELLDILQEQIEDSQLFENAGIKGFVEEALFSWYLDVTETSDKREVIGALKRALTQFSLYRMGNLTSARSRDVLKGFYQALVPDALRKSLGEFYTPDWLVQHTTERAGVTNWLEARVLDPTCGSGSFLLNAIKLKRQAATEAELTAEETIDMLTDSVWGFDLNPLAVQSARVNYLISISDLVKECGAKQIELPILLADSVYSPARELLKGQDIVEYKIGSKIADLHVKLPRALVLKRDMLDSVFTIMGEAVDRDKEYSDVEKTLIRRRVLSESELASWREQLQDTYEQVLALHKDNWNGIWFKIIRNFFWTTNAGKFDVIVGNPPWVRWSALPVDYREKVKETCEAYEIFSDTKFHGGNELDISGMIIYTVADTWLKDSGVMAFVIPQNHFQTPSSQGFRSFLINKDRMLVPEIVDDLKALKPFNAANKTAVVRFRKTELNDGIIYPVDYKVWTSKKGFKKAIPEKMSLQLVRDGIDIETKEANPVSDLRSPWAIMLPHQFARCESIRGSSEWVSGRKGVTADLNGIYMVEISETDEKRNLVKITTRPEAGKKDLGPAKSFWVEPDLLYPLVKGAGDFSMCHFKPKKELYIFVPNKGIKKQELLDAEDIVENDLFNTFKYFCAYEDLLLDRSTYKQRLAKYAFYHIYNVGNYSFSPYKVIWAEQSGKFASVVVESSEVPLVGERPYVPDHKIYYVDCYDKSEAYYLCGLLCAPLVRDFIESHTISIQVSNIFKHMNLPKFDSENEKSIQLAKLIEAAHNASNEEVRVELINQAGLLAEDILI